MRPFPRAGSRPPRPRTPRLVEICLAISAVVFSATRTLGLEVPGTGGKVDAAGYVAGLAVVPSQSSPTQDPEAVGNLTLTAAPTRNLQGVVTLRGRIGGPFVGGPGVGVYNFGETFQNVSPAVEFAEAYATWMSRHLELRAGIQRLAWGKLDGVPPTDVLNPRDFHDPFTFTVEEQKIGIPLVTATAFPPAVPAFGLHDLRATLVYVPFAVPPRLPLLRERWFPQGIRPPSLVVPENIQRQVESAFNVRVAPIPVFLRTKNNVPARTLGAGGVGLKIGGTVGRYDFDLYHYTGPATGPDAAFQTTLSLNSVDSQTRVIHLRANSAIVQHLDRVHMTGADVAAPLGRFTLRAEAAYLQGQPFERDGNDFFSAEALSQLPVKRITREVLNRGRAPVTLPPLFPTLDAVAWGVGIDTVWRGWIPLVQMSQIVFTKPPPALIVSDPETAFTTNVRKRFFNDRFELEFRTAIGVDRAWWFLLPKLSYFPRDDIALRLGYLALGGPRNSVIGQFGQNDELILEARYTF